MSTDTKNQSTVAEETPRSRIGRTPIVLLAIAIVAVGVSLVWLITRDAGQDIVPGPERTEAAATASSPVSANLRDLPCRPTCENLAAVHAAPIVPSIPLPCTPTCANLVAVTAPPQEPAIRYDLPCTPVCGVLTPGTDI